ncbi:MAG: sigma factor-like helix-turn-helix DNA-binding protein [Bdellovibrionales bacterium]
MKKYNHKIKKMRETDAKMVSVVRDKQGNEKFTQYGPTDVKVIDKVNQEYLLSSEDFIVKFKPYIDDIARFKKVNDRKYLRSTNYALIGCMTANDMYQEAYLAFLEAYDKIDWTMIDNVSETEKGAIVWSYLKKSTLLNFERQLRNKKDGIRIPERQLFNSDSINTNVLTQLFSQIDRVFFHNQEEVALTKWETDLIGAFMDVHMDKYLDLTRNGNRDLKKNERAVLKALYGLDEVRMSYKDISDHYKVSQSTIRSVKERAIKRLKTRESIEEIADFLHEYRINTQADTEKYRK